MTFSMSGKERLASMLAGMSRHAAERLIEQIRSDDPALADWLAMQRVSFTQILQLPPASLALLIGQFGDSDLLLAIRGLSAIDVDVLLGAVSKRRAELLRDELQLMAPVPKRDVEDAQRRIVNAAQKMEAEGRLAFTDEPMID